MFGLNEATADTSASSTPARCTLCGSERLTGVRLLCEACNCGDRQRAVNVVYEALPGEVLATSRCLIFSAERWIEDHRFNSVERSIYGGDNHLDLMAIDRPNGSYDWIVCNHVLEHVPDDRAAVKQLLRILSAKGVVQITVPSPMRQPFTLDWHYPDKKLHGHYRTYGSDFLGNMRGILEEAAAIAVIGQDPLTDYKDFIYLLGKRLAHIERIGQELIRNGRIALRAN